MDSSRPSPPPRPLDLDFTIVSAKHLKNVNWKVGELKPYCVFWVDPDNSLATRSDDSGSTRPVWNERFTLPLPFPLREPVLTLDIFHSIPSETPKPLVATLRIPLKDLPYPDYKNRIRTFELSRPSGRPQGKIRVKIGFRERPVPLFDGYHFPPPPNYYYNSAPTSPHQKGDYRGYSLPFQTFPPPQSTSPPPSFPYSTYPPSYAPYSPGYYYSSAPPPPLPPRAFYDRTPGGFAGPSAPVDYSSSYDQKSKIGGKKALGAGLAAGAAAAAVGGLAVEEGLKFGEENLADRLKKDLAVRDDYSVYHADF